MTATMMQLQPNVKSQQSELKQFNCTVIATDLTSPQ